MFAKASSLEEEEAGTPSSHPLSHRTQNQEFSHPACSVVPDFVES